LRAGGPTGSEVPDIHQLGTRQQMMANWRNVLLRVNLYLRLSPLFGTPSGTCMVLFCRR